MKESSNFEESLEKGREIIEKLMNPEITLEESVILYEEGMKRVKEAQKLLEEAKMKVKIIEQRYREQDEG